MSADRGDAYWAALGERARKAGFREHLGVSRYDTQHGSVPWFDDRTGITLGAFEHFVRELDGDASLTCVPRRRGALRFRVERLGAGNRMNVADVLDDAPTRAEAWVDHLEALRRAGR